MSDVEDLAREWTELQAALAMQHALLQHHRAELAAVRAEVRAGHVRLAGLVRRWQVEADLLAKRLSAPQNRPTRR